MDSKIVSTNHSIKEHLASIAGLESRAKDLEDQRIKIQQLHDRIDSSSFRIPSVIPSEILGEIFIACLPQYPRPIITEAPLLLCRICTSWRRIALNTPQLWTFITLDQTKEVLKLPQVAEKWFSLAGVLPLSLRFNTGPQPDVSLHPSLSRSLPFNDVWSRLSNLELNAVHSYSVRTILRTIRPLLDFSKIERVAVRTDYPLYTDVMSPETFPNIRKLIVSYKHPVVHRFDLLPFPKLTHLCLSGSWLSAQSWSLIIRKCIALHHGLFAIATMDSPPVAGRETTLEHLLTLKIVLHTFGSPRMMDNLHFPSLRSLSIGCVERPGEWNSNCLSPIKLSQLRSLVLYRLKIPIKDLLDILRTTTSLESLVIDLPIRTTKFFEGITQSSDIILPLLTRLTVFHSPSLGKSVNAFDVFCFVNMVKSRWDIGNASESANRRRLSVISVRFKVSEVQAERARRFLGRWLQEGLVLNIGVSPHGLRVSTDVSW